MINLAILIEISATSTAIVNPLYLYNSLASLFIYLDSIENESSGTAAAWFHFEYSGLPLSQCLYSSWMANSLKISAHLILFVPYIETAFKQANLYILDA